MKKTWNNPAIEDLGINSTAMTNRTGVRVDGGTWNNVNGEASWSYFPSGHAAGDNTGGNEVEGKQSIHDNTRGAATEPGINLHAAIRILFWYCYS